MSEFEIRKTTKGIDFAQVTKILNDYGLSHFDVETQQKVFENSYAVAFLLEGDKVIGMGRAISDGICQAALYNLALLPEYCGRGLGRQVLDAILEQVEGCNVIFYTSPKWLDLYTHWGFDKMKTGFSRYIDRQFMLDGGFI